METLAYLWTGLMISMEPGNLVFIFVGVLVGQIIGALPGVGPSLGMVLLLPMSFGMQPDTAIMMLSGIMYGAMYGGTLTSVLINMPGESASVMTTVEGYPLARQGRAGAALSVAAIGSFVAGILSLFALIVAAVWLGKFALKFSAPEYFLLAALGIVMSATLGGSSFLKSLGVAAVGLAIGLVGADPMLGTARMTFGIPELLEGIDFIPVAIGIFGIAEVLHAMESQEHQEPLRMRFRDMMMTAADWRETRLPMLRGSVLGFLLGILPGLGPTTATFIAYAVEKKLSKHPERFGKGALDGLASCEAANNSSISGGLVPMLTFGIPSTGMTAVLLAAFILHDIRPGPTLLADQPQLVWSLIASMFVGNVILLILNLPLAPLFASILRVPYALLAPAILLISLVGAYATTLDTFTIWLALFFGVIGYLMMKVGLPRSTLILSLVLAPILESSLRQSLIISRGTLEIFVARPVSAVLLVVLIVALSLPAAFSILSKQRRSGA